MSAIFYTDFDSDVGPASNGSSTTTALLLADDFQCLRWAHRALLIVACLVSGLSRWPVDSPTQIHAQKKGMVGT